MNILADSFYNEYSQIKMAEDLYLMNCEKEIKVLCQRDINNLKNETQMFFVFNFIT